VNVVFRVDSSAKIGTGHVIRCLTLANTLKVKGAEVIFICRDHQGHIREKIIQQGFKVILLKSDGEFDSFSSKLSHAKWLGCSWKEDAQQTLEHLNIIKPEWLIVDHYGLDKKWENAVKPYVSKLMVIDDIADRLHKCDLLLDQNIVAGMSERYLHLIPQKCSQLLGPDFALLQPAYAKLHIESNFQTGIIERILVYFGGVDENNLTGRTISAFISLNHHEIDLDVVIPIRGLHVDLIAKQAINFKNIHLHTDLPTLAPLMKNANLSIGAGGVTSWERCCLGLPAITITDGENQNMTNKELEKLGAVKFLGKAQSVSVDDIYNSLNSFIKSPKKLKNMSIRAMELCDGKGVIRVAEHMLEHINS